MHEEPYVIGVLIVLFPADETLIYKFGTHLHHGLFFDDMSASEEVEMVVSDVNDCDDDDDCDDENIGFTTYVCARKTVSRSSPFLVTFNYTPDISLSSSSEGG